jgi:hypothetical protein
MIGELALKHFDGRLEVHNEENEYMPTKSAKQNAGKTHLRQVEYGIDELADT